MKAIDGGRIGFAGRLIMTLECDRPDKVKIQSGPGGRWSFDKKKGIFLIEEVNGFVNTGLNNFLNRAYGVGGTAVGFIGVGSSTSAVTAATVNLNGASGGTAANTIIKAITAPAATTTQVITVGPAAAFVNADFTSGVFAISKVGLLTTSTDAGTGLIDVIGGTGGSDPYSRTFSVDFTAAGTFTLTPQIQVTGIAVKGSFPSPL